MKILFVITISMILFAGCATQKEIMLQQGHSLAYAEGFEDGCHSGNKAEGSLFDQFKKDENRFAKHKKYTQGWSDGFRQCESEQEALDRQIRMSMEQERLDEARKRNDRMDDYMARKAR